MFAAQSEKKKLNPYHNDDLRDQQSTHTHFRKNTKWHTALESIMNFVTHVKRMAYYTIKTIAVYLIITGDSRKRSITVTGVHVAFMSKMALTTVSVPLH